MRHAAEARPPRRPDHAKLAHEGHQGTLGSAADRGPVRAVAETASPLDCPRAPRGCQATCWHPVGAATRSNSCGALPAPMRPPRGTVVSTGAAALCPCSPFLSPLHPLTGALRSFLPPCKRLYCNAAGLLRQGLASLHASTGRPLPSDHQRRCMVCEAGRGAGGPRSPALCVAGDSRRLRVPDAARAWAGGQRGGSVTVWSKNSNPA